MVLDLKYLMDVGAISTDTKEVKNFKDMIIPKEDYLIGETVGKIPVIDKPIWVGYSPSQNTYFTGYEKGLVGKFNATRENLVIKKEKRKGTLSTVLLGRLERKDGDEMDLKEKLAGRVQGAGNTAGLGGVELPGMGGAMPTEKLGEFNGTATIPGESQKQEMKERINKTVSANIAGVELAENSALTDFCREHGEVIGFVTTNDSVIKASTAMEPKKTEDGSAFIFKSETPDSIRQKGMTELTAAERKEFVKTEANIVMQASAPGPIKGVVLTIPKGGYVNQSALTVPGTVKFDSADTEIETLVLSKAVAHNTIVNYFDGKIRESAKTFKESASVLNATASIRIKKKTGEEYLVKGFKADNGHKLILPNNYLPIKVYDTIKVNKTLTQEEVNVLNQSTFIHLWNAVGNRVAKATQLSEYAQELVHKDGDQVVSKFFQVKADGREPIRVKEWWKKPSEAQNLSDLKFPIKEAKVTSKTKELPEAERKYIWKFKTFDCLSKEVEENAAYKNRCSLWSGEFDEFLGAANEAVTLEQLILITKKIKKAGKNKTGELTVDEQRALSYKESLGKLSGIKVSNADKVSRESILSQMGRNSLI